MVKRNRYYFLAYEKRSCLALTEISVSKTTSFYFRAVLLLERNDYK